MKKFNDFIEALKATKPGGVVRVNEHYTIGLSEFGDKCWTRVVNYYYVEENDLEESI
jgi:hypothetical protein